MVDVSKLLKVSGIDTKRTGKEILGNGVETFAKNNLDPALKSLFGQSDNKPVNRNDGSWYATSYAHSLANTNYRPKLKFLFKVEFLFKPQIIEQYPELKTNQFVFMIRSVDRPKVDFEYEEVNQYNFRTKVLKQIKHRELTITFMDDVGNQVYNFFRIMMMVHSPVTRRSALASHDITGQIAAYNNGSGMLFDPAQGTTTDYAHRGAIPTDLGNAIQVIKITQMFAQPMPGADKLDGAAKEVSFFFMNPRIVSFDLDDVNHETSDPNLFTMQFDYDFMVMAPMRKLTPDPPEKRMVALPGAPGDPAPTGRGPNSPTEGGGFMDQTAKLLSGIGGRAAQRITSEVIGKQLRKIPGMSNTATLLGGLVGSTVQAGVGGLAGGAMGLVTTLSQSLSRPGRDVVSDNSTAGKDKASATTSTGGFGLSSPRSNPFGG